MAMQTCSLYGTDNHINEKEKYHFLTGTNHKIFTDLSGSVVVFC